MQDQDGAAPSGLLVDKSLDTMNVFHDVVGADVLSSLTQERELFALRQPRSSAAVRYFSSRTRYVPRSGRARSSHQGVFAIFDIIAHQTRPIRQCWPYSLCRGCSRPRQCQVVGLAGLCARRRDCRLRAQHSGRALTTRNGLANPNVPADCQESVYGKAALHDRGCSCGLNPPVSSSDLAM